LNVYQRAWTPVNNRAMPP